LVLDKGEKSRRKKISESVRFPYYVLFFSIILTIGATVLFYQSAKAKDDIRFSNNVARARFSMENRIGLYVALLKAGRGFIQSSNDLNRQRFKNFVESLELEKNYYGAQGIGYSKTIRREEREALINSLRSQGLANYNIFPASEKDLYQPIVFIEPFDERNRPALGFDMASEENRLAAMQAARNSGAATSTGKIILLHENEIERQPGFLIYLPIYSSAEEPPTVEERQNTLQGYIYSPFRAKNFLQDVQNNAGTNDIIITIYDGSPTPENVLARTDASGVKNFTGQLTGDYWTQNEIEVGGRQWTIQYNSLPSFAAQSSVNWTPLIFLCGLIFSLLLFGMTYWEAITRAKLQQTANDLTDSERQIQGCSKKNKPRAGLPKPQTQPKTSLYRSFRTSCERL
jgi:CHASE1-domain containing sensor protein